jgi:hypothetical protein
VAAAGSQGAAPLPDAGAQQQVEAGCVPATTSCDLECGWIVDECGRAIPCGDACPAGWECVSNGCVCVVQLGDCGALDSDCDVAADSLTATAYRTDGSVLHAFSL